MMAAAVTSGGTARHICEVARGCYHRGFDVHVVCAANRDPAFSSALNELHAQGIAVDELDMRREIDPVRDGAAAIRLRRLVASSDPDVLHLHSSKAGALGRVAAFGRNRHDPVIVYSPHAYAFLTQAGLLNRLGYWCAERALLRWTDCVVAVSKSEERAAAQLGGDGRVVVIPNGVDVTRIASRPAKDCPGRLRIGWLGRMTRQKRPEAAIKVSGVLSNLGINHQLLLGGGGPEYGQILRMARQASVEDRVRVLGHVLDTDAFYGEIDVLLMTSQSEGLPYAGLDAMAHGIPIVGFDVPGVRDLVEDGVTGLLAPPGDIGVLARQLSRLVREDQRRAMGAAAGERVRESCQLGDHSRRRGTLLSDQICRPALDAGVSARLCAG
jgi:glycosyltransferase involved in cell wall biosynthesis